MCSQGSLWLFSVFKMKSDFGRCPAPLCHFSSSRGGVRFTLSLLIFGLAPWQSMENCSSIISRSSRPASDRSRQRRPAVKGGQFGQGHFRVFHVLFWLWEPRRWHVEKTVKVHAYGPGQLPSESVDNFDWNQWTTWLGILIYSSPATRKLWSVFCSSSSPSARLAFLQCIPQWSCGQHEARSRGTAVASVATDQRDIVVPTPDSEARR